MNPLLWLTLPLLGAAEFRWEEAGGRLSLTEGGKTVLSYHRGADRDCCYLHPILTPSGVSLTDDAPADHPHHRGLYWAWPVVEAQGAAADLWILKGGSHRFVRIARQAAGKRGELTAEHAWMVGGREVARDRMELTVHPARGASRMIELTLTVRALGQPVRLAGTSDHNKGYGGLTLRFAPREQTVIRSAEGAVAKDEDHGRHKWAELEAVFQGRRAGIRVESDASNPGHPNEWILRHYGLLGENYPGTGSVTIEPERPLRLRYRLTVYEK